jgi:hypothetical protein
MQTILGANGVIGRAGRRLPPTDRVRLVSRTPRRVNGAMHFVSDLLDAAATADAVRAALSRISWLGLAHTRLAGPVAAVMWHAIDACARHDCALVF